MRNIDTQAIMTYNPEKIQRICLISLIGHIYFIMKIKEIKDGDLINNIFLTKEKRLSIAKNGSNYLSVRFVDNTGEIDAKLWDEANIYNKIFKKEDFVRVKGKVINYQGAKQIQIKQIERIDDSEVNISDYLQTSEKSTEDMIRELKEKIDKIKDMHLTRLLSLFYEDTEFIKLFKTAPAAKSNHHAYIGGLLQHTLEVANLCEDVTKYYPEINTDLLITGAVLHDIGKVHELKYSKAFGYTDEGGLIGHITIGVEMIAEKIRMIDGFPHKLEMLLKHMILSHHGHYEYGSPKRPKILEAIMLYHMDEMNAKVDMFRSSIDEDESERENWTAYNKFFERYLFKNYK